MKGVQCYELFGGIALKNHAFSFLNRPAHSKATLGDRSFSFASTSVWNSVVTHHCHHLSLVLIHTCFVQFTKTVLSL